MAALTAERVTQKLGCDIEPEFLSVEVAASTKIFKGALVVSNATGFALGGTTATTHVATLGRAEETVDNSAGSAGALRVKVRPGVYKFNNSAAADAITRAEVGTVCYVVDDNTVAKTNGTSTRSVAGPVISVDSDGVWVLLAPWAKRA